MEGILHGDEAYPCRFIALRLHKRSGVRESGPDRNASTRTRTLHSISCIVPYLHTVYGYAKELPWKYVRKYTLWLGLEGTPVGLGG
jgi:hypothetical protein